MKMKKMNSLLLVFQIIFLFTVPVFAAVGMKNVNINYRDIKIKINSELKKTELEPFIYNNSTYVPLRFISEALGANVDWEDKTSTISIDQQNSNKEHAEIIEEAKKLFKNEYKDYKVTGSLTHKDIFYYYVEMIKSDGTKEYSYYNPKVKAFIFFLEPKGA